MTVRTYTPAGAHLALLFAATLTKHGFAADTHATADRVTVTTSAPGGTADALYAKTHLLNPSATDGAIAA